MKIDQIDVRIIECLQADAGLSQRAIAERVGLSQNACWRRIQRLERQGLVKGSRVRLDRAALGLDLTVFMMVRTRHHAAAWSAEFRAEVEKIPEVVELHRIGGEWDYLIKIVTVNMAGYDAVYQKLTARLDLENVTGYFSMETILEDRPLAIVPGVSR